MRALMIAVLMPGTAAATELLSPAMLQAQVEAFAGGPAIVDPRLLLPACPRAEMAFAPGGKSVMVRCAAPEWRVFVPVGSVVSGVAPPETRGAGDAPALIDAAMPLIRRGDRVVVEVAGDGFTVGMEAIAEADSRGDRVNLRPANGGRRLVGHVAADGRVHIRGLNSVVNGR
jgi:flagella basal body P-ring formation protein FlgA